MIHYDEIGEIEDWKLIDYDRSPILPQKIRIGTRQGAYLTGRITRHPKLSVTGLMEDYGTTTRVLYLDIQEMTARTKNSTYCLGKMCDGMKWWLENQGVSLQQLADVINCVGQEYEENQHSALEQF